MSQITVTGGKPLKGRVELKGAKNLVTKAMVAALRGARHGWRKLERTGHVDAIDAGVDGVEATRQIMAQSPCPILIVTASVGANFGKVYEALGYDEYSLWIDTGMSFERKRASLQRFIEQVMPAFA